MLTVNTAVVHIGFAFSKKIIVLTGPSLDFWNPSDKGIVVVKDPQAMLIGSDGSKDKRLPQVARITVQQVLDAFKTL